MQCDVLFGEELLDLRRQVEERVERDRLTGLKTVSLVTSDADDANLRACFGRIFPSAAMSFVQNRILTSIIFSLVLRLSLLDRISHLVTSQSAFKWAKYWNKRAQRRDCDPWGVVPTGGCLGVADLSAF
jgi:hypothetical protein